MASKNQTQYTKLKRLEDLRRNYALFFYKPYGKQLDFHGSGAVYRERLLMAGNQLGKCGTIASQIDTEYGPLPMSKLFGKRVKVRSWPDSFQFVIHWVRKPAEECFRITFSDGRWFECPRGHRLLTNFGWFSVGELLPILQRYAVHDQGFLSNALASGLHSWRRFQGWFSRCFVDSHRDGGQLLQDEAGVQVFLPREAYVPTHNHVLSHLGASVRACTNIARQALDRLSNWCVALRPLAPCALFANLDERTIVRLPTQSNQEDAQSLHSEHLVHGVPVVEPSQSETREPSSGEAYDESKSGLPNPLSYPELLQSVGEFCRTQPSCEQFLAYLFPAISAGNSIIHLKSVGCHVLYDLTVANTHNYCAAGLIHHNTFAAGNEVAYHLTGIYPDWWTGKQFERAPRGWVGSVTSELTRDGAQRILLGPVGKWGTGCIPKELIIDIKRARGIPDAVETVLIKHIHGDISQITFKSYKDGREAWQAETLDFIWYDEEPPEDIYSEGVTRTNNTRGLVFLTFTPLLGMSNVVMRFLGHKDHPDRHVTNMTINDVEHYDEDQKRQIIEAYPPHEREARAMGTPMLGSGRIFPVAEEVLREDPIGEIPKNWQQIIGMDFGWDHPTAAVRLAYDEENDIIHVVSAYRQSEATPLIHAASIRPWGDWIPVAWPHDALQHDKSGEQYRNLYADQGLSMLSTHAAYGDKRGNGVEEGLMDMLQRMQTGRFKVDRTLSQWWEEFRMYHRKDGKVIKERDDLMSATRYGVMMLRYAIPGEAAPQRPDRYARYGYQGEATWMSA